MQREKFVSIIIPVHNEERRLSAALEQIIPFVTRRYSHEIIIVDNGSTDATLEIIRMYVNTYRHIYGLSVPCRGKGLAVKRGMLFAEGKYRYMCDVDLSAPIEELPKFLELIKTNDIVIGSRALNPALVKAPLVRRMIGRGFRALVNDLTPGILDTQCGFKLFRDYAARAVFDRLKIPGLAFDVEALYLAKLLGYRIAEMPVQWVHHPDTRVRWWDSLNMARDVLSIPWMHAHPRKSFINL